MGRPTARKVFCPECPDHPRMKWRDGWTKPDGGLARVYECLSCGDTWKVNWPAALKLGEPPCRCPHPHVTIEKTTKRYVQERA